MDEELSFSELRQRGGWSLEEVADQLGYSLSNVYRWERGELKPKAAVTQALKSLVKFAPKDDTKTHFNFIDLFAGIGGLRIGFEAIGGHCVFTSEWDKKAQETYAANFRDNHHIAGDVREYSADPDLIPEHDLLLAGFPCQPFSIAGVSKKNALGRPHGFLCDTQGTLFFDTAKIIAHHQPAVFVLENVKNLERHDGGQTFRTMMNVLQNELGYHVQKRVISAEHWVPQKRERIFIVGFREKTAFDLASLERPADQPTLGGILQPHDEVDPKYTLTPRLWDYLQAYKAKHQSKGNGFGFGLFGPDGVARTLSARYYKDGSEILVAQPGNRPRRLTPLECARLMGFDRGERRWIIPKSVSDTQAYRQFGNAVVVPVVEFLAQAVKPHIGAALSKPRRQPLQVDRRLYG